jgi:penicillin G amidase
VAWGFTNTGPDVQDLYLEQINPANPAQYKTPTGWADFETRTEAIKVKGMPDAPYTYRSTRHGPVLSDAQAVHAEVLDLKKYVLALRWSALDEDNRTLLAGFKAQKAQSVGDLLAAYADYHSPMQNVVAADTSGKIAYKAVGKVPVRSASNDIKGIAPAPGWDAKYDWAGWLPYAQTPQDDGKKGWVATANQRIHAPDYPHFITQDWASPQRFDRIEALLATQPKHDMASMQRIQADTTSIATQTLLPVLRATTSTHALAAAAQAQIKSFDANMQAGSSAALVFATWADELARGLINPQLGDAKFKAMYGKRHFRATVEEVMARNDAFWCAPKTCPQQSTDALDRALDRLSKLYGADPAQWRWGAVHSARSIHKPLGNVPLFARFFDVTTPTGGDPWTVNVGQYWLNEAQPFHNRHAASLRSVFDLSNLENSQFVYQTGQSGLVFSSRYRDMNPQWSQVEYRPLQLQGQGVGAALVLMP